VVKEQNGKTKDDSTLIIERKINGETVLFEVHDSVTSFTDA